MTSFTNNDSLDRQRWVECKNAGPVTIPAYGVVEITGSFSPEIGRTVLNVRRPTAAGLALVAVNGVRPIPAGMFGRCSLDYPAFALYDTSSTPAAGESWGTQSGAFSLKSGNAGFLICGGGMTTPSRVRVIRAAGGAGEAAFRISKADESVSVGGSGAFSIYDESGDTGDNVTAHDWYLRGARAGERAHLWWERDIGRWYFLTMPQKVSSLWNADGTNGSDAVDAVEGYTLEDNGTITHAGGHVESNAWHLDGSDDYLQLASSVTVSDVIDVAQDWWISGWFNIDALPAGDMTIYSVGQTNPSVGPVVRVYVTSAGTLAADVVTEDSELLSVVATGPNGSVLSTGTWYFFSVWWIAAARRLFLTVNDDGTDDDSNSSSLELQPASQLTWGSEFSGGSPANHFDGMLEQISITQRRPEGAVPDGSISTVPIEHLERYNNGDGATF